jgi:assimilatory nitrate reductase catalytic subunit
MTGRGATATTCPYCGVGCGVLVAPAEGGGWTVRGDPDHPANLGRLCSKGAALADTLGPEDRLLRPVVHGVETDWDGALDAVAGGLRRIIDRHGPDAVALYVSGQLLTEDYYVANKLAKGFLGTANIDTNSRLCMASAVAAYKRAFGADTVPCSYEDLEESDLVVLVGSNLAWCHPVLFQRLRRAKERRPGMRVVVVDPRRTATCDLADLHLPLAPGADGWLFAGLLSYLKREDALDWSFLEGHVEGFAAAFAAARAAGDRLPEVAARCGLDPDALGTFFRWFARTERVVTLWSQGINQSSSGTDKGNAIINCHLATGRIGRPGMGPFSITGQPNAMGGREVGGLANTLAAHMDFTAEALERLGRFWGATGLPEQPGLKAVDLFQAIGEGRVKAVWIMATNPMVSLPDAGAMREALARCELVVVSDSQRHTDTTAVAHVLLPAATWGEKSGTVTNSERRISRQRAFLAPPGEARPDWWILAQVAHRLGYGAEFAYESPAEIFREHALLSGFENAGDRDFDIGALAELSDTEYEAMAPVQWPVPLGRSAPARLFADGRFFTPGGKARMVPLEPRDPAHLPDGEHPLVLNTGRTRDQWHTMTRTGRAPRLNAHMPEPVLQLHPDDGQRIGVGNGQLAVVTSRWGEAVGRVDLTPAQRPGSVFAPIHWSGAFGSRLAVGAAVNPVVDPLSGEPEFKHTPVRVVPLPAVWQGFVLSRRRLDPRGWYHWTEIAGDGFWRYELAGDTLPPSWLAAARRMLGEGEWLELEDRSAGRYRGALLRDGRLEACLFVAPTHQLPPRNWLGELFARDVLDDPDRASLLAGRPAGPRQDPGAIVCSCFGVGRNALLEAVRTQGLATVEAIGAALRAGTNCGSCIPELHGLLVEQASRPASGGQPSSGQEERRHG